jgi:hypothetical protein
MRGREAKGQEEEETYERLVGYLSCESFDKDL